MVGKFPLQQLNTPLTTPPARRRHINEKLHHNLDAPTSRTRPCTAPQQPIPSVCISVGTFLDGIFFDVNRGAVKDDSPSPSPLSPPPSLPAPPPSAKSFNAKGSLTAPCAPCAPCAGWCAGCAGSVDKEDKRSRCRPALRLGAVFGREGQKTQRTRPTALTYGKKE